MKDVYKNPILYCIAVPVIVGLWPLLVWTVYLPAAQRNIEEHMAQYKEAETKIMEILTIDPERLEFADSNDTSSEFTYTKAIGWVANRCGIPPSKYNLRSAMIITTQGQKSQSANVDLKQVSIVNFTNFLSMIQLRWANLQCERLKLSKKQNMPDPDIWDVDIEFKYYF